jgi:hypothetical protein
MKKIAATLGLILALQTISTAALASYPPGNAAGVLLTLAPEILGLASAPKSTSVAQNEFSALNDSPVYESLLKQTAGGELNTLEILK